MTPTNGSRRPPTRENRPPAPGRRHPRNALNDLTGPEWIQFTKSWFVCDSPRYHRNRDVELHPARFPEEMVSQFLLFFTKRGQWVLDPFAGSGATLVACHETGRSGVGIELNERYADKARSRLAQPAPDGCRQHVLCADARRVADVELWEGLDGTQPDPSGHPCPQSTRHACLGASPPRPLRPHKGMETPWCAPLSQAERGRGDRGEESLAVSGLESPETTPSGNPPGRAPRNKEGLPQFDFIITSPPYWRMLRTSRGGVFSTQKRRAAAGLDTHYSDFPADLGNIEDYGTFIEELGAIFDRCAHVLADGKYLVVVAQNLRTPAGEVAPLAWDLARRLSQTFLFQGERIWCQNSKRLGIWGYPTVFVPNYHHHYCLIFRKPARPAEACA
jgi:DNA modification methylase